MIRIKNNFIKMMKKKLLPNLFTTSGLILIFNSFFSVSAQNTDSVVIRKMADEIFISGQCYKNEEYLCKKIGARLSGSSAAQKAVEWTCGLMKSYGFDTVYLQDVMVPHWVRGEKEVAKVLSAFPSLTSSLDVVALGGSIATSREGISAEVVEVGSFDELKNLGKEKIAGKIVFYNHPFDVRMPHPSSMYEEAGKYRYTGAVEAARYGAVASVVRSMTNYVNDDPHTGAMRYNDSIRQIPACAVSTLDAEFLSAVLKKDSKAKFFLKMNCQTLPDMKSYNVIGEIKGSEHPGEIIVVGGHLDSWDLAEGASDDGTGVMQSIEVLRVLKKIGVRPKRTIRAVMFMNEENGLRGGKEYAEQAKNNNEKHIMALESDNGGFTPRGISMNASNEQRLKVKGWSNYFLPYDTYDFDGKGGGADVTPMEKLGVPVMELRPDGQRYFLIHHTRSDTFELVNKRELEMGAIVMTVMVYLVSEYGL
jgi:carboxypeptidase Q